MEIILKIWSDWGTGNKEYGNHSGDKGAVGALGKSELRNIEIMLGMRSRCGIEVEEC